MEKWPKLCNLCGMKGPSHCSKCKKSFYCSRKHQILDWQKGHKELCPQLQVPTVLAVFTNTCVYIHSFFLHTCFENKLHTVFVFQTEDIKYDHFTVTDAGKTILFKEWELIVDEEDEVCL